MVELTWVHSHQLLFLRPPSERLKPPLHRQAEGLSVLGRSLGDLIEVSLSEGWEVIAVFESLMIVSSTC